MKIFHGNTVAEKESYHAFIDGLRGIAILLVVLAHSYYALLGVDAQFKWSYTPGLLDSGQRGVQLFFMLSAFTLYNSSAVRFHNDKYPYLDFYIRRAFRIMPFYWVMCVFWSYFNQYSIAILLSGVLFYFGFIPGGGLVPGGWSIFAEETFYIMLPILFVYVRNISRALWVLLATFALSRVWLLYADGFKILQQGDFHKVFAFNQWWCFALGIVIYYIFTNRSFKTKLVDNKYFGWGITIAAVLASVNYFRYNVVFSVISLAILFVASIPEKTIFGRIARNKVLIKFGGYCYSIYFVHFLVVEYLKPYRDGILHFLRLTPYPLEVQIVAMFIIFSTISLGIAYFTFHLVENPCVQYGKRFIPRVNTIIDLLKEKRV
jgi:peptidoglycan/LPS O-acetylase OafA/YrhL